MSALVRYSDAVGLVMITVRSHWAGSESVWHESVRQAIILYDAFSIVVFTPIARSLQAALSMVFV